MNDFILSLFLLTPDGDHRHCELSLQSSPIRHYMVRMSLMFLLLLCTMTTFAQQVEVTLTEAGTLSEKIASDQKYEITSLKVSGPINGTDVRYLREMAGQNANGYSTNGKLVDLDLTDARIVEGGSSYYFSYNYTGNDILGDYMFRGCNLKNIVLPSSVTSIGEDAFYDCSGLTSITIPGSVTKIGGYAFYGCSGLTSITIPSSVTNIGNSVFSGCTSLNRLKIEDRNTSLYLSEFSDCPLDSVYRWRYIWYSIQ